MEHPERIMAQSKNQLAVKYCVSLRTFVSWLEPLQDKIGEYRGKAYTPKQVEAIYEYLGHP
jgi:hypothetical protein